MAEHFVLGNSPDQCPDISVTTHARHMALDPSTDVTEQIYNVVK